MKVLFFDTKPIEKEFLEKNVDSIFEKHFFKESLNSDFIETEEIKNAEIISVFVDSDLQKTVLQKFPNLKFIILRCVGFSNIDLSYAKEMGIKIFNAPHYGDYSVAEYVFASLLAVVRKIPKAYLDVMEQNVENTSYQGFELQGKTMGIVGLGAIGKKVYEIANVFNLNPIYYDVNKENGYNYAEIDDLCKKSDIISINCPLTSNTLHMFDKNKFELMKKGVIIINTARGEVINTIDLYNALISGKIGFAALDVVECENIFYECKNNKVNLDSIRQSCLKSFYVTRNLSLMENVLITPHIAYSTKEAQQRILEITVENLISSLKFTNSAKNLVLI